MVVVVVVVVRSLLQLTSSLPLQPHTHHVGKKGERTLGTMVPACQRCKA